MDENKTEKEDWQINIRTDLWNSMTVGQLNLQRELILDKITLCHKMPITQTVHDMLSALQLALTDLNNLVDNKFDTQQHRTTF